MFPVEEIIPAIKDSLERNRTVVLRSPPGSGKTTCLPRALMDSKFLGDKKILMLEPRRLAARSSAQYIASCLGETVGGKVGFQVRLERKISSRTKLEIITEGLLTQRILNDPELHDVGIIIFDEFHERSLACDLGFALALDVRRAFRPDLRIVVMSATLDVEPIAKHLEDADIHTAQARMYPVETVYLRDDPLFSPVHQVMANAVRRAVLSNEDGDILCFLPGEGEIRRTKELLDEMPEMRNVRVMPLYGAMSKDLQDEVLRPCGRRKIVLSTSIAETSLTIEGVRIVIDSGLMRVSRFSPNSGMSRLETLPLTKDRAEQRRGRAGRTAPGVCYRLWTEAKDFSLKAQMNPEIEEADLTATLLSAASWGSVDIDGMPWLTTPPPASWSRAKELLYLLGALDGEYRLTDHGKSMSALPVHPRLANMILRARSIGLGNTASLLAAILEEMPNGGPRKESDLRNVVDFVHNRPNERFSKRVRELASRWSSNSREETPCEIGELLVYAFPDRIAHNRGNGSFRMTSGKGAFLDRTELLSSEEYLVVCELNDGGGDAKIHLASPVSEAAIERIFADEIKTVVTTEWNKKTESVDALKEIKLHEMTLHRSAHANADENDMQSALFEGIRLKGVAQLEWTAFSKQLQSRINFLHREMPDENWPDVSDESLERNLEKWFAPWTTGMTKWTHLEKLDLVAVLDTVLAEYSHDRRELDRFAPVKMEVPSGSMMTIHYEEAEPFVQVRIQEVFGLKETPKVANGKIPIVMKLLSPAQRPVQITRDLSHFWKSSYELVRKDLRGRYPKHYWPDNPLEAVATKRTKPQK
ncbi:MAG: ATP-dependent helicase HrpB [Kiritimatiellae bacterium]|nr:ATP-dependent helicase HrpB [Kiritimatiellia bacterium]